MSVTAKQLLDEARLTVGELSPEELRDKVDRRELDILIDVREVGEWGQGHLAGAVHVPRGMLEWLADPSYPKHEPKLAGRLGDRIAVVCASGGRSLLAAKTLRDMGFGDVSSVRGGLNACRESGIPLA